MTAWFGTAWRRHGDRHRDARSWMVPLGVVAIVVIAVGTLSAGGPQDSSHSATGTLAVLAVAVVLWLAALSGRIGDDRVVAACLVGFGLAGAGLDLLQPAGPGFVAGYMAVAGLALRLPRRAAVLTGAVVLVAVAYAEAHTSTHPLSAALNVALGAGFLFAASAFAAVSRDARAQAEALLAQEAATRVAREQAAALAERSRLAREIHDVLAHTLSGLAVQLEGARLLAAQTGSDPRLAEQITRAQRLARDGMAGAKRAVSALRGDALPGPALLPALLEEVRGTTGIPATLETVGEPRVLAPEAGLTLYRTVQEALTNIAKYAGRGARARVVLSYAADRVTVEVTDAGGDQVPAGLPSGGFGLSGMGERAALLGGSLDAGPTADGFRVHLILPVHPAERRSDAREETHR